jgi:hypothetical protein
LLRDLHHQTWELELLISGSVAIVLALLPARVDAFYFAATAQTSGAFDQISFLAFYFIKLTLYTLIAAFAFHIAVRAFWVSLVGLDSVFPRGTKWDRLNLGPITERAFRRTIPSVRELVLVADAIASVTFASAFSLVAIFAISVPWALVFGGVSAVMVRVLSLPIEVSVAVALGTAVVAILLQLPLLIDRSRGREILDRGGGHLLERLIRLTGAIMGLRVYGAVQYTLASNVGRRTFSAAIAIFAVIVVGVFILNDAVGGSGSYAFTVDAWDPVRAGEGEVDPRLYEGRVDAGQRRLLIPTVPDPIVDDETPYVRLFVPLLPESDPPALARVCPDMVPPSRPGPRLVPRQSRAPSEVEAAQSRRLLDCRARLWEVELDGRRVDESPVFMTRQDAGLRGLAWFLDVRGLEPGRHVIDVRRSDGALDPDRDQADDELPRAYRIPFWN